MEKMSIRGGVNIEAQTCVSFFGGVMLTAVLPAMLLLSTVYFLSGTSTDGMIVSSVCRCDADYGRIWVQQDHLQDYLGAAEPADLPTLRALHLGTRPLRPPALKLSGQLQRSGNSIRPFNLCAEP